MLATTASVCEHDLHVSLSYSHSLHIDRYAFKADAKTAVVPEYGDATMGEENDW